MLEQPPWQQSEWSQSLYRANGADIADVIHRPVHTGDVYKDVMTALPGKATKKRSVIVLTHPCAMRNGVQLKPSLLVAVVRKRAITATSGWPVNGHFNLMPLPDLHGDGIEHCAEFDNTISVPTADILAGTRVAVLELSGFNLLHQRLVFHLTRTVIPTADFRAATTPAFEETDLVQEWIDTAFEFGIDPDQAEADADAWLSATDVSGGETRRQRLAQDGSRPAIRQGARKEAKLRYQVP